MKWSRDIQGVESGVLVKWLSNCVRTYTECMGRERYLRNLAQAGVYERELKRRGVTIPSERELCRTGKYDGDGTM